MIGHTNKKQTERQKLNIIDIAYARQNVMTIFFLIGHVVNSWFLSYFREKLKLL